MKSIIKFILISLLVFILEPQIAIWGTLITGLIISIFIYTQGIKSFLEGFLGSGLSWWAYAYFILDGSEAVISSQIADLFQVSVPLLVLLSGIIGGIIGGLSSLTGSYIHSLFIKKEKSPSPYYN
ncbi:MAG: hypothetical protein OEY34_10200 [Cyclobacteriaceae bacterium]|nr:hypothetical protein [Cyclobacteriaceae bacterium]